MGNFNHILHKQVTKYMNFTVQWTQITWTFQNNWHHVVFGFKHTNSSMIRVVHIISVVKSLICHIDHSWNSFIRICHRSCHPNHWLVIVFMPDALPDTTLLVYPGLFHWLGTYRPLCVIMLTWIQVFGLWGEPGAPGGDPHYTLMTVTVCILWLLVMIWFTVAFSMQTVQCK